MQLFINTPGSYLHVKDQLFEVRLKDGAEVKKSQFAAAKVKTIVMTTGAALSTDAIHLAMQHNVDIVFAEPDGSPIGRVWHSKLGSTTKIRKMQLTASLNQTGVGHVKQWLLAKLDNQRNFIQDLKKHRELHADYLSDKVARIEHWRFPFSRWRRRA